VIHDPVSLPTIDLICRKSQKTEEKNQTVTEQSHFTKDYKNTEVENVEGKKEEE